MSVKIFPVLLTFDVDAETLWLARDAANIKRPVQMSQGDYGPLTGVPRILRLLNKYDLKASFFFPGMTAEKFPESVVAAYEAGHEIGNHSWTHKHPYKFKDYDEEYDELLRTNEILEKLTGEKPKGYKTPAGEFSAFSVDVMEEMGFRYGSNMMNSSKMHMLKVNDHQTNILEIPLSWHLDDAAYWLYSATIPGKAIQSLDSVEDCFKREFDVMYKEFMEDETGDMKNLIYSPVMHPQVIGLPARTKVLENIITYFMGFPNIQFLTFNGAYEKYLTENK